MKKEINTSMAPAAIGPYSQAIKVGNLVVIDTAPEQLEIQLTPPFPLSDGIIVETFAELVRTFNLVCHNLITFKCCTMQKYR